MNDSNLILKIIKWTILLLLAMLACKYTAGAGSIVIVVIAFICAFSGKLGWGLISYILLPFMVIMNGWVLPKSGLTGLVLRIGPFIVTIALAIAGSQRVGRHTLPLGAMAVYLFFAAVSSMNGYNPMISYLKLFNFAFLIFGIWISFKNIDKRPQDVDTIRMFLLTLSAFLIWGSLLLYVFAPGMAYALDSNVVSAMRDFGLAAASEAARSATGVMLFCGITNQSQCLGATLPMTIAFLACDMFFVERRISKFHIFTIIAALPMVYMTRSRTALLTTVVAVAFVYFYCLKKINLPNKVRSKLRSAMTVGIIALVVVAGVLEMRNHTITKWLRKTEDVAVDSRGIAEAVTESRMGKVEENLFDFKRNPLMGTGFQVTWDMQYMYHDGLVFSAPLEKGVLPLMVLGETGVIGFIAFLVFLISFYSTCIRKKYFTTVALMTVFLTTNMAEATYFSPGGMGGFLWVMSCGGGFVIDTIVLFRNRQMQQMARMPMGVY